MRTVSRGGKELGPIPDVLTKCLGKFEEAVSRTAATYLDDDDGKHRPGFRVRFARKVIKGFPEDLGPRLQEADIQMVDELRIGDQVAVSGDRFEHRPRLLGQQLDTRINRLGLQEGRPFTWLWR